MTLRERIHAVHEDEGFSLVEVVVAMVVFAIMVTAVLGILVQTLDVTKDNTSRVIAANLATKQIEAARSQLAINIPDGATSRTETLGGTTYTVTQNANYVTSGSSSSLCQNSTGSLAYKLVTVTVSWPDMGTIRPVKSDTVKALGVGADGLDQALGAVAINVTGASGDPQAGITVTLTPGNLTRTTGIDGCAVFVNLPVGSRGIDYTATVNQVGYVNDQENATSWGVTVGAVAGEVRAADLKYARERTLRVQVAGPAGYTVPATGFPIGFRNTVVNRGAMLPACTAVSKGCATTAPGYAYHLFPDIYELWAGDCTYARPLGASASIDLTTPGDTVVLPLEGVLVRVVDIAGSPISGYTVKATSQGASGCSSGRAFTLPSTGGDGSRGALYAGSWEIEIRKSGRTTRRQTITLNPGGSVAAHTLTIVATS